MEKTGRKKASSDGARTLERIKPGILFVASGLTVDEMQELDWYLRNAGIKGYKTYAFEPGDEYCARVVNTEP